jgi:outer membrane protein
MRQTGTIGTLLLLGASLSAGAPAAEAQAGAELVKVGVFDPSRVFETSALGKKMRSEIEALTQKKRSEVQGKEEEIKALQEKFKQEEPSLSEDKRGDRERVLQQKGIELKRLRDDASREVQAQVSDIEERFQKQVLAVIETMGREDGFTMIFDRAALAFSAPAADVTERIVNRLNATQAGAAKTKSP